MVVSEKQIRQKGKTEENKAKIIEFAQNNQFLGKGRLHHNRMQPKIREAMINRMETIVMGGKSTRASLMNKKEGLHIAVKAMIKSILRRGLIGIPIVIW
jgi:hypothetical protein